MKMNQQLHMVWEIKFILPVPSPFAEKMRKGQLHLSIKNLSKARQSFHFSCLHQTQQFAKRKSKQKLIKIL